MPNLKFDLAFCWKVQHDLSKNITRLKYAVMTKAEKNMLMLCPEIYIPKNGI